MLCRVVNASPRHQGKCGGDAPYQSWQKTPVFKVTVLAYK